MYAYLILLGHGCTKKVYVPVEKTTTVTVTKRDTIVSVRLDKEIVRVTSTKDTAAYAETKYAEAKALWCGDSETLSLYLRNKTSDIPVKVEYVEVNRIDSVPVPYPVEKVVELQYVAWYDKVGRVCLILLMCVIAFFILRSKLWK